MPDQGEVVEYRVGDQTTLPVVVLDTEDLDSFDKTVSRGLPRVKDIDLAEALERLRPGVDRLVDFVQEFDIQGAEVEFGIELSAKFGAVIAAGEGKVNFKVRMKIGKGAG